MADASEPVRAPWHMRFVAWLIDVALVLGLLWYFAEVPLPDLPVGADDAVFLARTSVGMYLYWWFFESYTGQPMGKLVVGLKTTDPSGETVGFGPAAIECFGKAFLLPVDLLVGWYLDPDARQRLFNRLSNTVVIEASGRRSMEEIEREILEG